MESSKNARDYVGIRKSLAGHSLGELEAQILDVIWDLEPPVTTSQVFKVMYPRRELSYTTIMLTMSKLARKGILTQKRTGKKKTSAFTYTPNLTRETMAVSLMNAISEQILGKPLHEAIVDLCGDGGEISPKSVNKLEALVSQQVKK